ncbi:uncharacterized protein LOC113517001 [Galleria mellonella]|uniref:Uncharacterized protein LOC113517001 n=1 Tax=Galleria mellonella TaxID=7137 RepID=A0ABM3MJ62_GALME|nr:uncharacterized protein LOC113517001 [Galleria mellonella]
MSKTGLNYFEERRRLAPVTLDSNILARTFRCEECTRINNDIFKKVAELKRSGLIIYLHKEEREMSTSRTSNCKKYDTFILHNTSDSDLTRPSYIGELCKYKTKCFHCKSLIQRVHGLLDKIKAIRKNEAIGVCDYCKQSNTLSKCKRCEYVVNKFLNNKVKQYEEKQERLKTWFYNVKLFLQSILEGKIICRHTIYQGSGEELKKLLQELKLLMSMRELNIGVFPMTDNFITDQSLSENKDLIKDLLIKLNSEDIVKRYDSNDHLYTSLSNIESNCACKYLQREILKEEVSVTYLKNIDHDKKYSSLESVFTKKKSQEEGNIDVKTEKKIITKQSVTSKENDINYTKKKVVKKLPDYDHLKIKKANEKMLKEKSNEGEIEKKINEKLSVKEKIDYNKVQKKSNAKLIMKRKSDVGKVEKKGNKKLSIKEKSKLSIDLIQKIIRERQQMEKMKEKDKIIEEKGKPTEAVKSPVNEEFLNFKHNREEIGDTSESVIECRDGDPDLQLKEMIKGTEIVPLDHIYKKCIRSKKPLLYKLGTTLLTSDIERVMSSSTIEDTIKIPKIKSGDDNRLGKGVIRYMLSNREFIDKGWTKLPTTKIMRRMNIYKMIPANPKYDWFERHKNMKIMYYDTGEKLAEINSDGCGKLFYKNGKVALDYYNSEEQNAGNRYVIFSSGEKDGNGIFRPTTVLGIFDYIGNGVVYDVTGNERLKYNQSEGIIIDRTIGPSSHWKWHDLNEPPVLQSVVLDDYVKSQESYFEELTTNQKGNKYETSSKHSKDSNIEMVNIELENFVKEKAYKLLQKFQPFQIKMKALKLNRQFSLRILDQANIYLLFREGKISLKLNIGLRLISNEIVDTETAEVSQVATRYDCLPPKSHSVAEIQKYIRRARMISKVKIGPDLLLSKTLN